MQAELNTFFGNYLPLCMPQQMFLCKFMLEISYSNCIILSIDASPVRDIVTDLILVLEKRLYCLVSIFMMLTAYEHIQWLKESIQDN